MGQGPHIDLLDTDKHLWHSKLVIRSKHHTTISRFKVIQYTDQLLRGTKTIRTTLNFTTAQYFLNLFLVIRSEEFGRWPGQWTLVQGVSGKDWQKICRRFTSTKLNTGTGKKKVQSRDLALPILREKYTLQHKTKQQI